MTIVKAQETSHPDVFVADGQLTPENSHYLQPSDPDLPIEVLRERFKRDGYLYLKTLLPREHALRARDAYFRFLSPSRILKPGTEPVDGIWNASNDIANFEGLSPKKSDLEKPRSEQSAKFMHGINKAHTEDWYAEDFCKHPRLPAFVARLTNWKDVRLYERSLLRCNIPNTPPIGVHYDQIFLRHGDITNITAWCAMSDIKANGGGLMYLEDSESLGQQIEEEFTRNAVASGLTEEESKNAYNRNMQAGGLSTSPIAFGTQHGRKWLVSGYEAGDVVLHTPFTVHSSTVNTDPEGTIRLSTDLRFYDATRPFDKRWTHHFFPGDEV